MKILLSDDGVAGGSARSLSPTRNPCGAAGVERLMRRSMASVAVLVVVATGCTAGPRMTFGASSTISAASGSRIFHGEGLRFRYPAGSSVHRYQDTNPGYSSIAYVSNQQMTDPCRTTSDGGGVCALAVTRLRPGGFVAVWRIRGLPVLSFDGLPGRVTEVSGRTTKLSIERPGTCRSIGGDVSIDAVVKPARGAGTWYEFRGCVRGPNEQRITRATMDILRSTTLPS
jgi:hypothetical protein